MMDTIPQTKWERHTALVKARFDAFIERNHPEQHAELPVHVYYYQVGDGPYQLWSCHMLPSGDAGKRSEGSATAGPDIGLTLWFLWDGREVTSYDEKDREEAFIDLIEGQRSRRLGDKFQHYASPLAVSAYLAMALMILIAILEICRYEVPSQLWSVFTAVIAFYFGRESAQRSSETKAGG
jgi:hypothetical protein